MEDKSHRIIGYYVTEKKNAKMNWAEFGNVCRNHGFSLVKLNLQVNLEDQGPFFAIIHKLTEIILKASLGDTEAVAALKNVESYITSHPEVIVLDPLNAVRSLLDRSRYYSIVQNSDLVKDKVFSPTFVELSSSDLDENLKRLRDAGVTYPFVCKPAVSHGSEAHRMAVVFNEKGVADCKPPCVAQSFINHNAVLYKIYIAGDDFTVSECPSLKNFSASDHKNIMFSTCDVSKPDSTSSLTVLDPEDAAAATIHTPDAAHVRHIASTLRRELGMILLGVDVVIENGSGRYGIIDINVFPSYDRFPNFFQCLMENILSKAMSKKTDESLNKERKLTDDTPTFSSERNHEKTRHLGEHSFRPSDSFPEKVLPTTSATSAKTTTSENDQDDSGFDTGDSSDERKKKWCLSRGRGGHGKKISQHIS